MEPPRKEYLAEKTAAYLKHRLLSGEHPHALPGERVLATSLGVSRTVIRQAVAELKKQGFFAEFKAGEPRRLSANASRIAARRPVRIGFVSGLPEARVETSTRLLFLKLKQFCEAEGGECVFVESARTGHARATASASLLPGRHTCDLWVCAATPDTSIADALHARGERVIGVNFIRDKPYGVVAIDARPVRLHAVNMLLRSGRTRVVVPVPVSRDEAETSALGALFRERQLPYDPDFNHPAFDGSKDDFVKLFDRLLKSRERPDAVALESTVRVQLVTLEGVLMKHRLRHPEDIAIVGIQAPSYLDLMVPTPGVYTYNESKFRNLVLKAVRDFVRTGRLLRERKVLEMEYRPGSDG